MFLSFTVVYLLLTLLIFLLPINLSLKIIYTCLKDLLLIIFLYCFNSLFSGVLVGMSSYEEFVLYSYLTYFLLEEFRFFNIFDTCLCMDEVDKKKLVKTLLAGDGKTTITRAGSAMVFDHSVNSVTLKGVETIKHVTPTCSEKYAIAQAQPGASSSLSSQMSPSTISYHVVQKTVDLNVVAQDTQIALINERRSSSSAINPHCVKTAMAMSNVLRAYGAAEANRAALDHPVFNLGNAISGDGPQQDTANMIRHADLLPAVNAYIRSFNTCSDSPSDT
jgi:hypothetical protein